MSIVILVPLAILLLIVTWQDFTERAVLFYIFPLLLVLMGFSVPFSLFISCFLLNCAFIIFLVTMLSIWFSIKHKKFVNITTTLIGAGDILFFIVLAAGFSLMNFIIFFIASLLLIIGFVSIKRKLADNVPLAGIQSLFYLILLVINQTGIDLNLYDDTWILNCL
jgi:hypothetical protein